MSATVRLHITPFNPTLLPAYLAPSVLPLARNISFHAAETFPDKGFGYLELPVMEAQKLKKKLNGSTLKGSKVRVEDAKPEKRKAGGDDGPSHSPGDRPAKRTRTPKDRTRKQHGVLEGVELPEDRKVKRGWTEKKSKHATEPELLFKTNLTPIAATEVARKSNKDKKKAKAKAAVVIREFEKSSKTPTFIKEPTVPTEKKPAVEYVDGQGWVDEDGTVVEAETGKARNRRALELVHGPLNAHVPKASTSPQPTTEGAASTRPSLKGQSKTKKQATPSPSPSESGAEDSSVMSASSDEDDSASEIESSASSPALAPDAPRMVLTPSSPELEQKEIHPLEALFKRPKPPSLATSSSDSTSTPAKGLAPINTSFSFFGSDGGEADSSGVPPVTPFTRQDLEWRGLRSAAPTPDTAAIGRRFSFPWRNNSQEGDGDGDDDDVEAGKQLDNNTKANSRPEAIAEVDEEGDEDEADGDANQTPVGLRRSARGKKDEDEKGESEFQKWFWENRGDNNRAWKKRRRETLKAKRLRENRKVGGRRG
ncbi:hypothetical protein EJ04DRAFT_514361 [Polyplosphaeria fusca]|uniref:Uncharacterized protein n=1 Tax=Polyplosphaeria fusca TaxID=682080 RepID=A0A9P4QUY3_9PLEO|nr:hypothetical protein EJ04DRAFT_514361 [Polyplosphaeria fusca]